MAYGVFMGIFYTQNSLKYLFNGTYLGIFSLSFRVRWCICECAKIKSNHSKSSCFIHHLTTKKYYEIILLVFFP